MSENSSNNENENDAESAEHEAHPKPKYDDVNMPVVVLLSILSAVLTFVIIAFVQGLYYSWLDSMVRDDWNSGVKTPQEQVIADQRSIRDGFYETKDGAVYVSVDAAAQKLIAAKGNMPAPAKTTNEAEKKEEKKAGVDPKPTPPGPENAGTENDGDKSNDVQVDPAKVDADKKDPANNETKDESAAPKKADNSKEETTKEEKKD